MYAYSLFIICISSQRADVSWFHLLSWMIVANFSGLLHPNSGSINVSHWSTVSTYIITVTTQYIHDKSEYSTFITSSCTPQECNSISRKTPLR